MGDYRKKGCVRWGVLLFAICLTLTLFGTAGRASAAETAKISGSAESAERGETVTVTFSLANNPGVWGIKGEVSYDSSVLTLKSLSAGGVFSASEIVQGENTSQNPFAFLATANNIENKTKNGGLIKVTFAVKEKAALGDYAVSIKISQFINVDGQDLAVSTAAGKITVAECLHRKTVVKNAVEATTEKEGYSGDIHCAKCDKLIEKGKTIPVQVCEHPNPTRTVVKWPNCEEAGLAKYTCPDCGKALPDETLSARGHKEGDPVNAKPATTTEEGYTGDILCQNCDKVLQEGEVIPKIPILVFDMQVPAGDTYERGSQEGLVFISEADAETFVRLEIDGNILSDKYYTVESGSTKVTVLPEYLEKLVDGKYTLTIVSDAGTASAQFYVATAEETAPTTEPTMAPTEPTAPTEPEKPDDKGLSDGTLAIIFVVIAVLCLGGLGVVMILVFKNKKDGRFSRHEEK